MKNIIALMLVSNVSVGYLGYYLALGHCDSSTNSIVVERNVTVPCPPVLTPLIQDKLADHIIVTTKKSLDKSKNKKETFFVSEDFYEEIIYNLPDEELELQLEQLLGVDTLNKITDKQQFSKRLAAEYFQGNSQVDESIVGFTDSFVSTTVNPEVNGIETIQIRGEVISVELYAHLRLDSDMVKNLDEVFIKWINLSSGDIQLFDKKTISKNTPDNWVSFKPDNSWKKGKYAVRFFKMDDQLTLLSQTTFEIQE